MILRAALMGSALAGLTIAPAAAADRLAMPVKAPLQSPAADWTQFYVGGGIGFDAGTGRSDVAPIGGPVLLAFDGLRGADLGLTATAGFDVQVSPMFVLGMFADYDWSRQSTTIAVSAPAALFSLTTPTLDSGWTVGGRAGILVAPDVLLYGLGGLTEMRLNNWSLTVPGFILPEPAQMLHGSTVGGGIEYRLAENLSLRGEYRYVSLGSATTVDPLIGATLTTSASEHVARVMATYRSGRPGTIAPSVPHMPAAPWSGFYGGLGFGADAITPHLNASTAGGINIDTAGLGGADIGGTAIVGYDRQVLPAWVVGAFGLFDLGSNGGTRLAVGAPGLGAFSTDLAAVERSWTAGGRAGYLAAPDTLVYGLAGYTSATFHPISYNLGFAMGTGPAPEFHGATVGGGFEKLFTNNFSARMEYRHTRLDAVSILTAPGFTAVNADATVHTVRLILSYRIPTP